MPQALSSIDIDGLARLALASTSDRVLIAIAGAPGSGKSTLAAALESRINASVPNLSAILPMDGFHFDDGVLVERGLLGRKGAPETFDVGGLAHMLVRLRSNLEGDIAVPVFDRRLEISRGSARIIPRTTKIVIVEGNYVLLGVEPWLALQQAFDIKVFIEVGEAVLRRRLIARWEDQGLAAETVTAKIELNDLPNGRRIMTESIRPDYVLTHE